jgi:HAD superfamily hydrolase (TIGR01549 family)
MNSTRSWPNTGCKRRNLLMTGEHDLETLTIRLQAATRPVRVIAFDLDSTLTRPYLDFKQLRRQLNLPEGDILHWLEQLPLKERLQAQIIIEAFEQDGVENVEWNHTAQATFSTLRATGIPLAIVTRNSRASLLAVCARLGIEADLYVAREDAPPKPNPACLRYVADQLAAPVSQLLMVGDYRHDTDAARAAGAIPVLLTNGQTPTWPVDADLVIERLDELLLYLR